MSFKKILLILICFIYYNSSFALEKNDTLSDTSLADIVEMFAFGKPKKSPFLKKNLHFLKKISIFSKQS